MARRLDHYPRTLEPDSDPEATRVSYQSELRALFERAPVGIALMDSQSGRFLEVNAALLGLLGYSRAEVLGLSFQNVVCRADEGPPTEPTEYELLRADGERTAALVSGIPSETGSYQGRVWAIIQSIAEHKTIEQHLAQVAQTDALTGLPNRVAFLEALERAKALSANGSGTDFAVFLLDFDRFKLVNDTLGHAAGDDLLRHIANRLRTSVRLKDRSRGGEQPGLAARLGGDEFAVLLTDIRSDAAINAVAGRLLRTLSEPYEIAARLIHSSASIGIVTMCRDMRDASEIMQSADVAMYEAKHRGRGRAVIFDEAMQRSVSRRLCLESDLRRAIEAKQLHVLYQPIIDLESGKLTSVEALVRWTHPELGPVSPSEFIPIAEESGLIVALGQFVLRDSCTQFLSWQLTATTQVPTTISVNLSRSELALGDAYVERLNAILVETGMTSGSLQLEVKEREIVADPAMSRLLMQRLKATGVRLAMDDFGTGASSLSCLKDFPFDTIKIDQSFVAQVEQQQDVLMVLHATVQLIENLGMSSVAEGVDSPGQVSALQSLGFRYAQGFLFSQPVSGEALLDVDCLAYLQAR